MEQVWIIEESVRKPPVTVTFEDEPERIDTEGFHFVDGPPRSGTSTMIEIMKRVMGERGGSSGGTMSEHAIDGMTYSWRQGCSW